MATVFYGAPQRFRSSFGSGAIARPGLITWEKVPAIFTRPNRRSRVVDNGTDSDRICPVKSFQASAAERFSGDNGRPAPVPW